MIKYSKIIFVSNSDTCRAQLACASMKEIGKEVFKEDNILVESRGVVVLFPEPMNSKAVAIAKSRCMDIGEHVATVLKATDFGMDVLVLTMTEAIKKKIYEDFKEAVNVYNIKEFVGEDGDIEAPYGGELQEYGELFRNIERLVNKVVDKLLDYSF